MKTDPATAHSRFREAVCAGLDLGLVPYAAIFPDLRTLARAAGIKRGEEEAFLADRLVRNGALAVASLKVWQAALPALEKAAVGDDEVVRLLIKAEPEGGADDPELIEQIRVLWLELLAKVGAGRMLTAEWFAGPGACSPRELLFPLVDQSDLPGWRPPAGSVFDDDVQFSVAREFAPGDTAEECYSSPQWVHDQAALETFAGEVRDGVGDRAVRTRQAEELAGFVARIGYFLGADCTAQVSRLWNAGDAVRDLLRDQAQRWLADAASDGLHALDEALHRLSRLADAGYQNLDDRLAGQTGITDPAVALMTALRTGLAAELTIPGPLGGDPKHLPHGFHLALDGERLTLTSGGLVQVMEPGQPVVRFPGATLPRDGSVVVWHDGDMPRYARRAGGRRHSFTIDSVAFTRARVTLEADPVWPQPLSESEVVFPGATDATRLSCADGFLYVHAPGGGATSRIPFGGAQGFGRVARLVVPPAWWRFLEEVDVPGSKALRAVDEAQARQLLVVGFQGPKTAAQAASEILPEVTHPFLVAAVAEVAVTAARCETNAAHLRRRLGMAQPASVPELLRGLPGLPFYRSGPAVTSGRVLDQVVREAFDEEPAADGGLRLVRTVGIPVGVMRFWYEGNLLGKLALHAAGPWSAAERRAEALENLLALANTPQADGSGRWRYRDIKRPRTRPDGDGQLWRTPTSVLAFVSTKVGNGDCVLEYAPEGFFDPRVPGEWAAESETIRMPGWGGADRVAAFARLLDEKGPAPIDTGQVFQFAEKLGIGVTDAAYACLGHPSVVRGLLDEDVPRELRPLYAEERVLSFPHLDALRERLMPADPADLWTTGLAVDAAAEWWSRSGQPGT